jgi:hypothetical protein
LLIDNTFQFGCDYLLYDPVGDGRNAQGSCLS